MSRGASTGRVRNYDDITDNRVSRRGGSSSKLLFVTILLALVICVLAVLIWVSILKSKDLAGSSNPATDSTAPIVGLVGDTSLGGDSSSGTAISNDASDSVASSSGIVSKTDVPESNVQGAAADSPSISMDIDNALQRVSSSESSKADVGQGVGQGRAENSQPGAGTGNLADYISSQDYSLDGQASTADVVTCGVEIKKPAIAQNLSISQQSSFSRDIVKYSEYTIQEGDSLDSIARKFGLTRETIISVNQIKSTTSLFIGSTLQIPDRDGTLYTVKEGDTLSSIVQQLNLSLGWKALSDVNGLRNESVSAGDKLFIPLGSVQETGTLSADAEPSFILPSSSAVTVALYNQKVADPLGNSAIQLDGILLQAADGTAVCASESGTVIDRGFNDNGTGFVKILHSNGYTTYYDYVSNICVNSTDRVSKGDTIGFFANGSTNLLNPTILFRIEQDGIPLDPYSFL